MPEPILCGLLAQAPLLPKLRGHFAEFLNNASPAGLRILSSSTCVGLRYGYMINNSGFSRQSELTASLLLVRSTSLLWIVWRICLPHSSSACTGLSFPGSPYPSASPHFKILQYRNLHLLSIDYALRPRLRSRLTQGRSALPWKPWIFGREDSHLSLATHSGILSTQHSTAPYRYSFDALSMLLYHSLAQVLSFGVVFQPRTFSAQDLSTSELLRTL